MKEYLLSSHLFQSAPFFHITATTSHSHISMTYLAYLAQFDKADSLNGNFRQDYPLACYAAEHWISHAEFGEIDCVPDLQLLAVHFFQHYFVCANWNRIWDIDLPWLPACDLRRVRAKIPPPLYYASAACLTVVAQLLLENDADVNARGGKYGNALQAASYQGSEAIVQLLIENGADINAQGGEYGTALQAASYRGHETIVELLIECGADISAQGVEYGSALQAASYKGYEAIVRLLIENGADINAQGGKYGSALQVA